MQPSQCAGGSITPSIKGRYGADNTRPIRICEASKFLAELVGQYRQTIFLIDALDECEDSYALLFHLIQLWEMIKSRGNSVKFFFTGRLQVELPPKFAKGIKVEPDIQRSLTLEDMKTYIRTQVEREDRHRLDRCQEQRLIDVLVKHANGM